MKSKNRSNCPVCYFLDLFGDRWTLLILRDILVTGKSRYREFLAAGEGIATNILSDRLKSLVEEGLLTRQRDPDDGTQAIYHPTKKAEAILPVLEAAAGWSAKFGPRTLNRPPSAKQEKKSAAAISRLR